MRHVIVSICLAATFTPALFAAPADDYRALTTGVQALKMGGTSGGVALIGRLAFPLAISKENEVIAGAGYFGDAEKGGRVALFAHTSFLDAGESEQQLFLTNLAKWAGRKPAPVVLTLGMSSSKFKAAGLDAKTASGKPDAAALGKADVLVVSLHSGAMTESAAEIKSFAARGGGVIFSATPWAAKKEELAAANAFLAECGLGYAGGGASESSYPVFAEPPSAHWSALNAIAALVDFKKKGTALDLAAQQRCSATLDTAATADTLPAALTAGFNELNAAYGWIEVTAEKKLRKTNQPIEAMLARYQARVLDTLPADKVPAHSSAKDFPGVVGPGPAVSKTIAFDATTGPDKLINHGSRTIINTGLYARPGVPITVTIPPAAAQAGLKVLIGIHIDRTFNLNRWQRFPAVTRDEELKTPATKAACAFGGIISIIVPAECKLGKTQVTIAGAVEAPVFCLGKNTDAEWNAKLKNNPGAWGYIETPKWTGYIPADILRTVASPEAVAKYWQRVVDTADEYMGYAAWRRRGEAMLTDRDITVGYGHAGYPVMMAYAGEKESGPAALVERGPQKGDWGFLHELGHTFQDSFDGNYTVATHAEVDVNLVPGIAIMLVHDRTCWDNNSHGTFDAKNRTKDWEKWNTLPEAERTWAAACKGSSMAYDFYFTLAECHGWGIYKTALGRIMTSLQKPGSDAGIAALPQNSETFKRDRLLLCLSEAAGKNLLPFAERYGLGKGEHSVSNALAEKLAKLPAWTGNQPVSALTGPATASVAKTAPMGTAIAAFKATDPDPGTRFTFSITGGNEEGAFLIEPRTGVLKLAKAPAKASYPLTLEVHDSTIPKTTATATTTISVR